VAANGAVFAYGDAVFHGSMSGQSLRAPIVGIAATPNAPGYDLVAADGGIFSFGTFFLGSVAGKPLVEPVVGMAGQTQSPPTCRLAGSPPGRSCGSRGAQASQGGGAGQLDEEAQRAVMALRRGTHAERPLGRVRGGAVAPTSRD
jgi:hypothetical protein